MRSKFTITLLSVVSLLSCSDYLETEQLTNVTSGNYFSTQQEVETALVGVYDGLQRVWSAGVAFPVASTVMADLAFGGTGAADADEYPMMDEFDQGRAPGVLNLFEAPWRNYYAAIFRANTLLGQLDNFDWGENVSKRNEIEAEARFIRAYCYFDLVRLFENIPLLEEPSSENITPADPANVYRLIAEDLLFAIENANDAPWGNIPDNVHGHAHKWAAQGLLGRVYLYYTGYYGESDLAGVITQPAVLNHLEDLVANGGFALVPTYSDLWPAAATYTAALRGDSIANNTYVGETNAEVVFAIKYTFTSDWVGNADGNHWMVMNGLRNQSWGPYGYGNGWGACSVRPEVYADWDPADARREASIMAINEEGIDFQQINDAKEYTGYMTKKYIPTADQQGRSIAENEFGGVNFQISQFQDYFSIRYADVLLMAAELGSPNALDYINQVRARAGVGPVSSVTKDIVFEERRLELAFEGHRYWDLLRYDNTLNYAAEQITYNGTVITGGAEVQKVIDGANLVRTRGLSQIPNNQITLSNGVLQQNRGW